jgi:glutamate racemase
MKIGFFDSGLGGLLVLNAVRQHLPQYDYLYLGDTLCVPYGNRSAQAIYTLTQKAVAYLFAQNCQLVIIACNTASASALRQLQQTWLPAHYPSRRVLGVVVPTAEAVAESACCNVGLIGTAYSVRSGVYADELAKRNPNIVLHAVATPLLVPLVEHDGTQFAAPIVQHYLQPLLDKNIDSLMLGCTHYPMLREAIEAALPKDVKIFDQTQIMPQKLADYLARHQTGITAQLSLGGTCAYHFTDAPSAGLMKLVPEGQAQIVVV